MPSTDFCHSDAGRSKSKRSKQRNDCTVRAVAITYEKDYDEVYETLADLGRKCARGFHLDDHLKKGTFLGRKVEKLSFPAVKGQDRMRVRRFLQEHPEGAFILRTAKHVTGAVDGVAYDTHKTASEIGYFMDERCLYTAYRILPDGG